MRSYTHGSHLDRLSCFLSFSTAPVESKPGVTLTLSHLFGHVEMLLESIFGMATTIYYGEITYHHDLHIHWAHTANGAVRSPYPSISCTSPFLDFCLFNGAQHLDSAAPALQLLVLMASEVSAGLRYVCPRSTGGKILNAYSFSFRRKAQTAF